MNDNNIIKLCQYSSCPLIFLFGFPLTVLHCILFDIWLFYFCAPKKLFLYEFIRGREKGTMMMICLICSPHCQVDDDPVSKSCEWREGKERKGKRLCCVFIHPAWFHELSWRERRRNEKKFECDDKVSLKFFLKSLPLPLVCFCT